MRKHVGFRLLLLVLFGVCSGAGCGAPAGGQGPTSARAEGTEPGPARTAPRRAETGLQAVGAPLTAGSDTPRSAVPPPSAHSADTDGDGVPDAQDQCPSVPEDRDGFEDEDGCPDPDNDGDGIPDVQDRCPNEPEDKDGHQDDDGCPDP